MFKIAASNIAWDRHDDPAVLDCLRKYRVSGIEVAPTKLWPEWRGATGEAAAAYRTRMADLGFSLPAMQSILFGRPELKLFDPASRIKFLEHLKLVVELADGFGAGVLVFGAPKNRRRGGLGYDEAMERAADFLRAAGALCEGSGCVFGIEANPAEYACDFATNCADVESLVRRTASPFVRLHFDTGAALLNGEDVAASAAAAMDFCHFHVSAPMLANPAESELDCGAVFAALRERRYGNWISLEMRRGEPELEALAKALTEIREAGLAKIPKNT